MSDLQKNKDIIAEDIKKLSRGIVEAGNRYKAAQAAGKLDEAQSYVDMIRKLNDQENLLQGQYVQLVEKEKQPELERISALRQELEKPMAAPSPNYLGMYGSMGNMRGTPVYDTSQPSVEEQQARKREIIGELYKAPLGAGGMEAEQLPAGVRGGVGALPTPESELEYLKMQYPDARITPMSVGNSTEFLIKTKDGKTFTTLDMGFAGLGGAAAVEAPIVVGSTAAGIAAALAAKSPAAGTAAAAGTEAVLGTAADMITRAALGMPQNIGENVMRRGTQAAIGGALGAVGDVAIPAARAVRMPGGFANEFMQEYAKSAQRLGLPEAVPPGVQFGPKGLEGAQELAGDFPSSRLGGRLRTAQQDLRKIFDPLAKTATTSPGDYAAVAFKQKQQRDALASQIAANTNQNKTIVEGAVNRLLAPKQVADIDKLGGFLRDTIKKAEDKAIEDTTQQYDFMAQLADDAGFQIEARELLDLLPDIKARINPGGAFDRTAVARVEDDLRRVRDAPVLIADLRKQLSREKNSGRKQDLANQIRDLEAINKPLDFKGFDAYIRRFNDARPDSAVGGQTKDVFGLQISNELSALRRDIYNQTPIVRPDGSTGTLGDEFTKAADLVRNRNAFEKTTLGGILRDVGGEDVATRRDVVRIAMKDPDTMSRVLTAAQGLEATTPGITQQLRDGMQTQYMKDIGIGTQGNITRLEYDQGILNTLYGADAGKISRGLDTLNEKLSTIQGVSISDLSRSDLTQLASALSKAERKAVADQIIEREKVKKLEEQLVTSEIFQAAKKGNFENIDPDLLSNSIFSNASTIRDVEIAMAQLNKSSTPARNLYRTDFLRIFLDKYNGGVPSAGAPYTPLFDVDRFLADYGTPGKPTELGKKVNTVLGSDTGTLLYDIAKLYQGNTIKELSKKDVNLRAVASTQALSVLFPIAKMTTSARNRFLAESLANGSERYGLRASLARNALPGEVNDAYMKMFKGAFKTRQGLTSLARMASGDPEFSAELEQAAKDFEEQEKQNLPPVRK
jgi:hypothetical protein